MTIDSQPESSGSELTDPCKHTPAVKLVPGLSLHTGALHLGLGWGAVAPQQCEVTAEGVGSRPWMRGGSTAFWTFVPKS